MLTCVCVCVMYLQGNVAGCALKMTHRNLHGQMRKALNATLSADKHGSLIGGCSAAPAPMLLTLTWRSVVSSALPHLCLVDSLLTVCMCAMCHLPDFEQKHLQNKSENAPYFLLQHASQDCGRAPVWFTVTWLHLPPPATQGLQVGQYLLAVLQKPLKISVVLQPHQQLTGRLPVLLVPEQKQMHLGVAATAKRPRASYAVFPPGYQPRDAHCPTADGG